MNKTMTFAELPVGSKFYLSADSNKRVLRTKVNEKFYSFECNDGKIELVRAVRYFDCFLATPQMDKFSIKIRTLLNRLENKADSIDNLIQLETDLQSIARDAHEAAFLFDKICRCKGTFHDESCPRRIN